MSRSFTLLALLAGASLAASAWGQAVKRDPHVGYLYPAGGQQGSTVRVLVGGQFLRGASGVHVTGDGVTGKAIEYYPPLRNLDQQQRAALFARMADCAQTRWEQLLEQKKVTGKPPWNLTRRPSAPAGGDEPVKLPNHFLLNGWEQMSLRELAHIRQRLTDRSKQQPNAQIAESVLIEMTIDSDATPGDRELRLIGPAGLTNPMVFQVGRLPETMEIEGNDPKAWDPLPLAPPIELPVVINGQIQPGDVDQLRFNARAGQTLVIQVQARHLAPFLADAVPGWFQPVIAVRDADGKELAFADDYQFDPDPVLRFSPPADGVYTMEIRDSIYRGREDFVYRVRIGELPFITSIFPLGGSSGEHIEATIDGWNLPVETVVLGGEAEGTHALAIDGAIARSNRVLYDLAGESGVREREPNDGRDAAQPCDLPAVVDGRMDSPGDVDVYAFPGRAGQRLVAEVTARRLRSPMDSLLRLVDPGGKVIAWNDDDVDKQEHLHRTYGTLTHQADSRLAAELPTEGTYRLVVSDATGHGGPAYAYRLRIGPPKPDFAVCIGPSSVNAVTGQSTPLTVHVLRRDGFEGPVTLKLVAPPDGFTLDGAVVPAGADRLCITLTVPPRQLDRPIPLAIEAAATIEGRTVTRRATPVDDVMQAFLWRHLVPSEQMLVQMIGPRRMVSSPQRVGDGELRLPVGGKAVLRFKSRIPARVGAPQLHLSEPPTGLSLGPVEVTDDQIVATVIANDEAKVGQAGNLIVELQLERTWKNQQGKQQKRLRPLGALPAIPYRIVESFNR